MKRLIPFLILLAACGNPTEPEPVEYICTPMDSVYVRLASGEEGWLVAELCLEKQVPVVRLP